MDDSSFNSGKHSIQKMLNLTNHAFFGALNNDFAIDNKIACKVNLFKSLGLGSLVVFLTIFSDKPKGI